MQQTQPTRNLEELHADCVICGSCNSLGLRVPYRALADGSVRASLRCSASWSGYRRIVHGGITTSLLDGAMVHCLFARGVAAVTVRMLVHFHGAVLPDEELTVAARLLSTRHGLHDLEAELVQLGVRRASATGRFMTLPSDSGPPVPEIAAADDD